MIDLKIASKEILEILNKKREELKLSFKEEGHEYKMMDKDGLIRNNFPSVSNVIDEFYEPFNKEQKSLDMCYGDVNEQKILLKSWEDSGKYATNKGSRVHYELELFALKKYKHSKKVRKPIFECDDQQIIDSDNMILAGKNFINLMSERGCELLETESVLGSNTLNYVGQCDNFWLCLNKNKDKLLLVITDYKTNKLKNLTPQKYNDNLFHPFDNHISYALTHYYIQLPLYVRLFFDMLKGSKYEDLKLGGCIIVSLRDDATFFEYKVPNFFIETLLKMDLSPFIKNKKNQENYYD